MHDPIIDGPLVEPANPSVEPASEPAQSGNDADEPNDSANYEERINERIFGDFVRLSGEGGCVRFVRPEHVIAISLKPEQGQFVIRFAGDEYEYPVKDGASFILDAFAEAKRRQGTAPAAGGMEAAEEKVRTLRDGLVVLIEHVLDWRHLGSQPDSERLQRLADFLDQAFSALWGSGLIELIPGSDVVLESARHDIACVSALFRRVSELSREIELGEKLAGLASIPDPSAPRPIEAEKTQAHPHGPGSYEAKVAELIELGSRVKAGLMRDDEWRRVIGNAPAGVVLEFASKIDRQHKLDLDYANQRIAALRAHAETVGVGQRAMIADLEDSRAKGQRLREALRTISAIPVQRGADVLPPEALRALDEVKDLLEATQG